MGAEEGTKEQSSYGLPCNIPRVSSHNGIDWRSYSTPVIFLRSSLLPDSLEEGSRKRPKANASNNETDSEVNRKLQDLLTRASKDALLQKYPNMLVNLSVTNPIDRTRFSRLGPRRFEAVPFSQYLSSSTISPMYFFGGSLGPIWDDLKAPYQLPQPCSTCNMNSQKTIGIGLNNSGISWHAHGPVFSETLIGTKRWLLLHPNVPHSFGRDLNMSVPDWLQTQYPVAKRLIANDMFLECAVSFGEILFIPTQWAHATINLGSYNFFISSFLEQDTYGGKRAHNSGARSNKTTTLSY